MASTTHMATVDDDARHAPGADSKPLWNESYWFAFYDPRPEIGVAIRFGMLPNQGWVNIYVLITHKGSTVYSMIDQRAALPPEGGKLSANGYTIDVERALERFHLTYDRDGAGVDVIWEAFSPTAMWPHPPGTVDQVTRHIEGAGTVKGTVTIGGEKHEIDCFGRRDHSFGGERNWASFEKWEYLAGEIDRDFWFNLVRIRFIGMPQYFYVGCLWDGNEVLGLTKMEMDVTEVEGGTRAKSVEVRITDERGNDHAISGETIACANVWFGPTCLREGFAKWTYGSRVGYGIHEHGYTEVE